MEQRDSSSETLSENQHLDTILDGCFGFGLSIGTMVYMILRSQSAMHSTLGSSLVALATTLLAAGLLLIVSCRSDEIYQKLSAKRIIDIVYIASAVATIMLAIVGLSALSAIFAAVAIIMAVVIYSGLLNSLPRKAMMLTIEMLFIYTGICYLLFNSLNEALSLIVCSVVVAASIAFTTSYLPRGKNKFPYFTEEVSKERNVHLKGNRHTLFAIGFMFAAPLLAFQIDIDKTYVFLVLGSAVALAGVSSMFFNRYCEKEFKSLMLKSMALVALVLLVPMSLVDPAIQLGLIGVYTFAVALNVIIVFNAVVETARFNMIAPIWLIGRQGGIFCCGMAVGSALFGILAAWTHAQGTTLACICVAGAIVVACMQIMCNYGVYPFESVIGDDTDTQKEDSEEIQSARVGKGVWQRKCEIACSTYKLSPRECEVLCILLKGRDTKYIMDKFTISQSTAKTHIYNIYRKFNVHSRQDLIDSVESIELDMGDDSIN